VRELSLTVPTARQSQTPPTPSATVKEGQSDGVAPGSASAAIADEVAQELLEDLFGALPQATRGVVCWRDPATNRLVPRAFKCRGVDDRQPVRLVRTLVTQAIDRRQAFVVVSGEGGSLDEAFRGTLRSYRHVMCAPLIANEGPPLGIVQIEALDPSRPFDKQDLETLTSVTVRCLSRL
jgi:GAF domain-containing protein